MPNELRGSPSGVAFGIDLVDARSTDFNDPVPANNPNGTVLLDVDYTGGQQDQRVQRLSTIAATQAGGLTETWTIRVDALDSEDNVIQQIDGLGGGTNEDPVLAAAVSSVSIPAGTAKIRLTSTQNSTTNPVSFQNIYQLSYIGRRANR